jgi:hypothetical protein
MRLFWFLFLCVCSVYATTISGNLVMGTSSVAGSSFNSLARTTPIVFFSTSGTITVNGISSSGAADGETVILIKGADAGSLVLNHANGGAVAWEQIILPNGLGSITISNRAGVELVYQGRWFVTGYT